MGDDISLTRWVKTDGRRRKKKPTTPMPKDATRTRFTNRVIPSYELKQLLVSGHSNIKIGRDVRKGALRGYYIYTLSLEERATCPKSCWHWTTCYGNSMPFAKRIMHGPEMLERLRSEIAGLLRVRGRKGVLIRLHALGDFYSTDYVWFWDRMMRIHPRLSIYGYTAHTPNSAIGEALALLNSKYGERSMIRYSNSGMESQSTVSISAEADCPPDAFVCPEQTNRTQCCATCAACWSTTKNVAFLDH